MATTENEVLLIAKDADGNLYLVYPATKASQVDGLDELLALKADKKTLLELDTTTQHSSMSDYTSSGMYWINPGVTTDVPGGQWGFLRVFAYGNILQEFTGYSENSRAVRMFVNNAWTTWSREHYGSGNGWSWEINPDGSVDLWCRQTVSNWKCTNKLDDSGWFRSDPLPRPVLPFSVSDQVTSATYVPSDGHGGVLWCLGQEGPGYCAQFYLVRHTSVAAINGVVEYHVHGNLNNSSSTSPGTKA